MNRTVYANLDNLESIKLAVENGANVEMTTPTGDVWLALEYPSPSDEAIQSRLADGYRFRVRKEMRSD